MADQQPNAASDTPTQTGRGGRPATDVGGPRPSPEPRAFAGSADTARRPDEGVSAARDMVKAAADATKAVGQRSREATHELATSWRGAVEPFMALQMDMNRWFDDLWRQATGLGAAPALQARRPFAAFGAAGLLGLPPVDIKETDAGYTVCAELPGLTRDDVDVELSGDVLVLSGHKAESKAESASAFRVSERRFGHFERRLPVPPEVDRAKVEASFRDGLLTVTLPKTAGTPANRARIEIRGG